MRLPRPLLDRLIEDIDKFQAEDALIAAQIALFPHIKKNDQQDLIRAWRNLAGLTAAKVFSKLSDFKAFLGEHGVKIK